MPSDQVLLTILVLVIVVNVFLVVTIPVRTRGRRRSSQLGRQTGSFNGPSSRGDHRTDDDARTAAAIEAFVDGVSADPSRATRSRAPSETYVDRRDEVGGMASEITVIPRRATDRPAPDDEPLPNDPMLARGTAAPEWTLAELADSATWSRTIREESARVARFGHPVTVVMAELPRLDVVIDRFGRGVGDRIATEAAHLLASEGRESDRLAWLGDAQFGVLLLETGEMSAGHYVERVRTATDGWLESTGLSIRLSLGWASPGEGGDVMAAAATAKQRMHDADRRSMPSPRPRGRSERRPHDPAADQ